jgi:photosystem II stability/assembly factor-like uncharacterized protein
MNGSGPLFKSTDDGASWIPSSAGISGTGVWSITGAGRPQVFYANPLGGNLFRSDDEGASWRARPSVGNIAVDPLTPAVLYAASTSGAFRSTDGGENWSRLPLDETSLVNVAIAPASPQNVYMSSNRGIFHTANGGLTWSRVLETAGNFTQPYVHFLAVDPQNADAVYASLSDGSVVRRDGGQQWTQLARLECPGNQLVFASGQPASIYARACGKVFKSIDRGGSWREVGFSSRTAAWIALDPLNANVLYVASAQNGVYRSRDGGETWTRIREPLEQDVRAIWVDRAGAIYIGATGASNGFITQFNSSGTVMLSTYLGGMGAATMRIAIDQAGTIVVGGNAGNGFPLVRPIQGSYRGAGDAFVARLVERR